MDLDKRDVRERSFEVTPDQYPMLERIARIIKRVLDDKPDEIFMIEGHTDANGLGGDNLSLLRSPRPGRAQVLRRAVRRAA